MYYATSKEMARLDRIAVSSGLGILQMMELAGFHMIKIFRKSRIPKSKKIVVLVGVGNKGGDGLSATRHLINHGWVNVTLIMVGRRLTKQSAHQRTLLSKMGIKRLYYSKRNQQDVLKIINKADVIIDSLIGYNLKNEPTGPMAELILLANHSKKFVIAYDMPSGIDATTGEVYNPSIKANVSLTLALPKRLYSKNEALRKSGAVYLGDIGIPKVLYDKIRKNSRPNFDTKGIIRL